MIKKLMTYGAVVTKCRAMYGKRLTDDQWERLMEASSLRTVWDILSRSPAWTAVAEQPQGAVDGMVLVQSLMEQLRRDCHNLSLYLPKRDRTFIDFFMSHQERGMSPEEYQAWWSGIPKKDAALRRLVGAEADGLNLVYVLRLRRFPASIGRVKELLIPVREHLRPEFIDRLLHAPNDEAALEILASSPWKDDFKSLAPGVLESQYEAYMRAFSRRILASANPGPEEIQAFLTMKDMDRKKLANIVAAVEQGIDPHRVV